jgi:ABC-type dipeptide/oligopeptide/nickel transport system permease subunit
MNAHSDTLFIRTWKRLTGLKVAMLGLAIIIMALGVTVFGYVLAPDSSPHANRMILEISGKPPGFKTLLLKIPKNPVPASVSFFHKMLFGRPDFYSYVPIVSHQIQGNQIHLQRYTDEQESVAETYSLDLWKVEKGGFDPKVHIQQQTFLLGTDSFGRDMCSRLILGTRVSMSVGCIAVLISLTLGIFLGMVAGYFGGKVDQFVLWFINVIWSIPTLLLVFAITLALGRGFWQVFIAVGLTLWVQVARIIRGQIQSLKEMPFVEAGHALGLSDWRIMFRHLLPNVLGPVLVIAAGNFATAIVVEAGLSFLGVGVQPPQPSWGLMIKENYNYLLTSNPLLAITPGLAIMLLVLAFNLFGNGLRDALDVRERV